MLFIGTETKQLVSVHLSKGKKYDVALFYSKVRRFYETLAKKLLHYLPLTNSFLRSVRILEPHNAVQFSLETSIKLITTLSQQLPTILTSENIDSINTEFRLFKLTQVTTMLSIIYCLYVNIHLYLKPEEDDLKLPTVAFWQRRSTHYPTIWILAKAALCVPHGNAGTERVFSTLNDLLTKKRNR